MSYDAWLERPYQDAAAESDAYVSWCEREGLDPDDDHYDEFRDAMDQAREDHEVDRYEQRMADREDEAREWTDGLA